MIWWQRLPLPWHKNRQRLNCWNWEHFIPNYQTTPVTLLATAIFFLYNISKAPFNSMLSWYKIICVLNTFIEKKSLCSYVRTLAIAILPFLSYIDNKLILDMQKQNFRYQNSVSKYRKSSQISLISFPLIYHNLCHFRKRKRWDLSLDRPKLQQKSWILALC